MRVAFVQKTLAPAGAERVLVEQARALSAVPSAVDCWLTVEDADRSLESDLRAAHPAVGTVDVAARPSDLRRALGGGRYDVVVTSGTRDAWKALSSIRRRDPRAAPAVLATLHGGYPKHVRALRRHAKGAVDVVVLTHDFRDRAAHALSVPRDRLAVARPLFPSVLLERAGAEEGARALRASWGLGPDAVVLGYFGRIAQNKGVAHWVGMVDRLVAQGVDAHVALGGRVAGKGSRRGTSYAQELGAALATASRLRGRVHRVDDARASARLYRAFDLMVLPSKREGVPLVLLEALSVGTPVLATAVGGIPTVLRDGVDAALVEKAPDDGEDWTPGDLAAFEARLGVLVRDAAERRRLGAAGADRVRRLVADNDFAGDFLRAVRAALALRGRPALPPAESVRSPAEAGPDG